MTNILVTGKERNATTGEEITDMCYLIGPKGFNSTPVSSAMVAAQHQSSLTEDLHDYLH